MPPGLKLLTLAALTCAVMLNSSACKAQDRGQDRDQDRELDRETLFRANCAECHRQNGQGLPNVYPALAGNETVLGSGADVALVLIIGRGEMPSFAGALSPAEMAAIINYVRNSWGNSGALISAEAVDALQ